MTPAPIHRRLGSVVPTLIAPQDTVKLAMLAGPGDNSSASVFYEVWEPGGSQPVNSHPDSVEIFVILSGTGIAISDEHTVDLCAGDTLVLPPRSHHRIINSSDTQRLYAVTIMVSDNGALDTGGFADLVSAGTPTTWDSTDLKALGTPS
jgi:mannose-6-phosphate isomerase-like protein (cupin superfamily)